MRPALLAWLLAALLFGGAECVIYSVYYQLGAKDQVGAARGIGSERGSDSATSFITGANAPSALRLRCAGGRPARRRRLQFRKNLH
jgi:hypothetical protein